MPRQIRPAAKISNRADRLSLPWRRAPYGLTSIGADVRLGYRRVKDKKKAGRWVAEKADGAGSELQSAIGTADDFVTADGINVLTFWQAADAARKWARDLVGGQPVTWAQALDAYAKDLKTRGGSPYNAAQVRNHLTALAPALLAKQVGQLTAEELMRWRDDLAASKLKPASVARILKSARASLNLAARKDHRRIRNREAWRVGLDLSDTDTGSELPSSRVVSDAVVHAIVAEAYALDESFGSFIHVAAETAARASQIAQLKVDDLQAESLTLSMPSSRKGSGKRRRAITYRPVPISADLASRLVRAAGDRAPEEPLLLRDGKAWELAKNHKRLLQIPFKTVADALGIKQTMYCLRHSAIVRALLNNVPTRLVAANADTSVAILERTYSKFISHHSRDIARAGLLAPNVVRLERRA
jgi:integrase